MAAKSNADFKVEGGCFCGAIRYTLTAPPPAVVGCHCTTCQKISGAPYVVALQCDAKSVVFSGDPMNEYRSSPETRRGFCGTCGTVLAFLYDDQARHISLWLSSLDDPTAFSATEHIYIRSKHPSVRLAAGLTLHDTWDGSPSY